MNIRTGTYNVIYRPLPVRDYVAQSDIGPEKRPEYLTRTSGADQFKDEMQARKNEDQFNEITEVVMVEQQRRRHRLPLMATPREHDYHRAMQAYGRRAAISHEIANRGIVIDKYF